MTSRTVSLFAGNSAVQAVRRVIVECEAPEFTCSSPNTPDASFCSTGEVCLAPVVSDASIRKSVTQLSLVGQSVVVVVQGTAYSACPIPRPMSLLCDLGAQAVDSVDGDVTTHIEACQKGYRFKQHGLRGCSINTDVPGTYNITFFLPTRVYSAASSIQRVVQVHARCVLEEIICSDGRCSTGGVCLSGPAPKPLLPPIPFIELLPVYNQTNQVLVPRGWEYTKCTSMQQPTLLEPCEPGANGSTNSMTLRVLACPPLSCLPIGCPGHEFVKKGLQGCGLDTLNSPVGTEFSIEFTVFSMCDSV